MKERFVSRRYRNTVTIAMITLAFTVIVSLLYGLFWDNIFCLLVVDFIFLVLFSYMLEHERKRKKIAGNKESDYRKVCIGFAISAIAMAMGFFLPEFLAPALFTAILMTGLVSREIGLCTGIFFDVLLCMMSGSNLQELALYCLMTLFGCMFADAITDKKTQIWCEVIFVCLSAILPETFYYIAYREIKTNLFILGAAQGLALVLFLMLLFAKLTAAKQNEVANMLDDILDDMYPLSRELLNFSKAEWKHAKRVSKIAKACAILVNADDKVCAAAGFYYRIGILENGSIAKNGVQIAQRACFPEKVTLIISEHDTEESMPSSVESAIVHMVDGLIKKMEVLGEQTTLASDWNQDMIIYQTLNDFSTKGIYDKSGLSMNMFLKIREYLVKEEMLL